MDKTVESSLVLQMNQEYLEIRERFYAVKGAINDQSHEYSIEEEIQMSVAFLLVEHSEAMIEQIEEGLGYLMEFGEDTEEPSVPRVFQKLYELISGWIDRFTYDRELYNLMYFEANKALMPALNELIKRAEVLVKNNKQ